MNKINAKLLDKKYFIFDIDGTLVDSMGMWNLVDQKVLLDNFGIEVSQMDIKILRDAYIVEIFVNGGEEIYSALL